VAERGSAPNNSKNSQWLILGASLLYTTIASYAAMNRDDTKAVSDLIRANIEAISQLRERVRAVEVRLERQDHQ
jgi:hypothetical protein